jgi:Mg2+/citrate symporter
MTGRNPRLVCASVLGLALVAGWLTLSGCGGSRSSKANGAGHGAITVTVHRPEPIRFIPAYAHSITITLAYNWRQVDRQNVPRSTRGNVASATDSNVVVDSVNFTATTYPITNGTGIAQAMSASIVVKVLPDTTIPLDLETSSTVITSVYSPYGLLNSGGQV